VIVATGAAVSTLKSATTTIPVVMTAALDPVVMGFVPSLVRPGGNLTGLSLQSPEATAKRLELLRELVPGGGSIGVVWNQASMHSWQSAQSAAQQRGWRLASLEIAEGGDWESAFQTAATQRVSALLVLAAQVLFARAKAVADIASRLKLPAMYELKPYVEAGGLMCYGPDIVDIWRRAASYVDRILDGARPGELPIEQPTRFEFVVNQRTARELGLTLPQRLLLRADEVIS
jgi:putative ABC transport system substrate-binding protein